MATGVHSSLRTASSAPRRAAAAPDRFENVRAGWRQLSPRARWVLLFSLILLVGVGLLGRYWSQSHDPRELYALPLTSTELKEVSIKLDELEIDHEINATKDNLLVAPDQLKRIKHKLQVAGVPHERPELNADNPMVPKTRSEQEEARQNRISARLAEQIEGMDGVQAASVNLAVREQLFKEDAPSTASVSLTMKAGQLMPASLASSITRLVAGAVPGLEAQNVALVDSSGHDVRIQTDDPAECLQQSLQAKLDTYLESKVQRMLDKLPGQATVTVCAEYDLSQTQVQRTDVGGVGESSVPLLEKSSKEFFRRSGEPVEELQVVDKEQDGNSYENLVTARRNKSDESYTFTVHKLPRLQKISCSVLADTPLRGSSAQIEQMIRTAVGIDPSRGDQCSVVFIPMAPVAVHPEPPVPQVVAARPVAPTLLLASAAPLGLVGALLWLGHRRVRQANHETLAPVASPHTLVDLGETRVGETRVGETRAHSVVHLEQRARQNPQQLAELLKDTWLS